MSSQRDRPFLRFVCLILSVALGGRHDRVNKRSLLTIFIVMAAVLGLGWSSSALAIVRSDQVIANNLGMLMLQTDNAKLAKTDATVRSRVITHAPSDSGGSILFVVSSSLRAQ